MTVSYATLKAELARMCAALEAQKVPDGVVFDSKLVARELLVNALRYGGERAYFSYRLCAGEIEIAVRGEREFCPPEISPTVAADAERGRGLFLVDALSERRSYDKDAGIRVVILVKE